MESIKIENLPEDVQSEIFESIHYEFWDSCLYNPITKNIRWYDEDFTPNLKGWLKVEF